MAMKYRKWMCDPGSAAEWFEVEVDDWTGEVGIEVKMADDEDGPGETANAYLLPDQAAEVIAFMLTFCPLPQVAKGRKHNDGT